jgi:hypothetical protein
MVLVAAAGSHGDLWGSFRPGIELNAVLVDEIMGLNTQPAAGASLSHKTPMTLQAQHVKGLTCSSRIPAQS